MAGPYSPPMRDPMGMGAPDPTDSGDGSSTLEVHSRAIMRAVKGGDAKALGDALKAFVRECTDEGYEAE